ncbi:MAG: hypothetical protein AB7P12_13140 [Alphaproteobacteria bacterium]
MGHGTIGGARVHVGCVPSKTMVRAAEALRGAHAAGRLPGLAGEANVVDRDRRIGPEGDLVATLRQRKHVDQLPEHNGVA